MVCINGYLNELYDDILNQLWLIRFFDIFILIHNEINSCNHQALHDI